MGRFPRPNDANVVKNVLLRCDWDWEGGLIGFAGGRMDEEIYEVDVILDARFSNVYPFKAHYVRIKWEGYSEDESTWEKISHLSSPLESYNLSSDLREKVNRARAKRRAERGELGQLDAKEWQ